VKDDMDDLHVEIKLVVMISFIRDIDLRCGPLCFALFTS